MNEFEIKAAKQALKELGLREVYNISDDYNHDEYDQIYFKIVAEFEYRGQIFHTYYGLVFNGDESNIGHLKRNILKEITSIDCILYRNEEEGTVSVKMFSGFICAQIEQLYVKEEKTIVKDLIRLREMIEAVVTAGRRANRSNIEIYKESLKIRVEG